MTTDTSATRNRTGTAARQAFLLRGRVARPWMWAAAMPLLWALGWTVTTAGGIGVDSQYAVFGAFGAITFMALSGVLLDRLRAATPAALSAQHVPARPDRLAAISAGAV